MKKLTKRLVALLMVVSIVCVCAITASAAGSGYVSTAACTAGSFKSSSAYKCYSAANTAALKNTYVYFKDYNSLGSKFASNNGRTLVVQLYDDDTFNDDLLKTYTGTFSGRTLSEINLTTVNWTDTNVEPSGDNGVELFIKYKVNKVTGDSTTSVGAGLFKFNVGIN